jgi:predicted RND superfamily exporter protein
MPDRNKRQSLTLGLERIGELPIRHPRVSVICILVLTVIAALGTLRLQADDSLSRLFQSDTADYRQYQKVTETFPSNEFDVLIAVESDALLERDNVDALRDFVTDLQLVDGVTGVISLFSVRDSPTTGRAPPPMFPADLPEGADYDALIKKVLANDVVRGKLLSEDGKLALVVSSLDPHKTRQDRDKILADIRKVATSDLGSGLRVYFTGIPVMQTEIKNAVQRDLFLYNALGFVAALVIAFLFFRRPAFVAVATTPPLLALLWSWGLLGWLGFQTNSFLNVLTPVIMVVSFADTMQITFFARDRILKGASSADAFAEAIRVVGPACILTHGATALSFAALMLSESTLIRSFGFAGLAATVIALCGVMMLAPLLGTLLIKSAGEGRTAGENKGVAALVAACGWIADRMVGRAGIYSLLSLVMVVVLSIVYWGLEPRYRLADQLPDKKESVAGTARVEAKLTGANPLDILIEFPQGETLLSAKTLSVIAKVHEVAEAQQGVANVWSVETLRRWLYTRGVAPDAERVKGYLDILPVSLVRRFVSEDQHSVIVSARVPDIDASELLRVLKRLDEALGAVRSAYPGYGIETTGLAALSARTTASIISRLNQALTVEVVFIAIFIAFAFRAPTAGLAAILPAVFPVLVAGAVLRATGEGLQFASIVALIVSFGLGLSATIHFLNRLWISERETGDADLAVKQATIYAGPAVMLTSMVLAAGLFVTVLSDLPSLRLFGWLSTIAILSAVFADMFILRPVATTLRRLSARLRPFRR